MTVVFILPPHFLFTSAAVPTHWHHGPTQLVWPVCQHCGVKRGRRWRSLPEERGNETRREWRGERKGEELISTVPSPSKPKLSFHRLPTELSRKNLLAEGVAEKHWPCTFFFFFFLEKSQDYLALDVCRVPEHAQKNPSDSHIQYFPSVCY